jgi:hypothetical protein
MAKRRTAKDYKIGYFDPDEMGEGAVILLVGRRGSGKSTLAADTVSGRRVCKRGLCISGTEKVNPFWGEYIPDCFIHQSWDPRLVTDLFRVQHEQKERTGSMDPVFAIFDDLMFNRDFIKSIEAREIFMNGRHSKIFTLVTAQWLMDVPPAMRANVDYVFVLKDNVRANRERVYTQFGGVFDDFHSFDEVMKQCTDNHECLVLRNKSLSYNVEDCVAFYKATPDLKYKLCAPSYWRFSENERRKSASSSGHERIHKNKSSNSVSSVKVDKIYPKKELEKPGYAHKYRSALSAVKNGDIADSDESF